MIALTRFVVAAALALCVACAAAEAASPRLQVARVFSDHMVLQREMPVPVWGAAAAGAEVELRFGGRSVRGRADDEGRWRVTLDPLEASAVGRDMEVIAGDDRVLFRDVLVGEVWFAGGQSNMQYTAGQMAGRLAEGKAMLDAADLPAIRLRRINDGDRSKPKGDLDGGTWDVCTPQSAARHSAVCFVFARRLHAELKVPIGVIDCSWGGTPIEPYIPRTAFTGHPTMTKLGELADAGDTAAIKAMVGGTYVRSPAWLAGAIYNARVAPVAPYAIRGAIWYQGESNSGVGEDPRDYAHKMRALIAGWRAAWHRDELPLYFVQLPQWNSYAWTYLRQEQLRALDVPATGMAVIIDLDHANDIHPPNKIDVGERLARWPLAKLYGRDVAVSGPLFRRMSVREGVAVIEFDHAAGGLMTARSGAPGELTETADDPPQGFELLDASGQWRPAQARIDGETIVLSSTQVAHPIASRYACHPKAPRGVRWNLYNRAGLPASPFCSDWDKMPYDPALNPMPK